MHWPTAGLPLARPAPVRVLAHGGALLAALFEDRRHFVLRLRCGRLEVHGQVEEPMVPFRGGATYAADDVAAAEVTADVTRAGRRAALVSMQGE